MKILILLWVASFILGLCPGSLTVNGKKPKGVQKILWSMVGASIIAVILGLPILGIISLF